MLKTAARLSSLLLVLAGFGLAQPVFASPDAVSDISTPAWLNRDLPLYVGPGVSYDVRTVLPGGSHVGVDRCSGLWCEVHAGRAHGYAFLYAISFGHGPNSIWWPPRYRHPRADRFSW